MLSSATLRPCAALPGPATWCHRTLMSTWHERYGKTPQLALLKLSSAAHCGAVSCGINWAAERSRGIPQPALFRFQSHPHISKENSGSVRQLSASNTLDYCHTTPLSAADIGCFRLSINHVRLQPVQFIGHWATTTSANHRAGDASAACQRHLRL